MAFAIYVDSGANLTPDLIKLGINVVPFTYSIGDDVYECTDSTEDDVAHNFYEKLRNKVVVKTSMINTERFMKYFRKTLEKGEDILYVGLSSGVSGTYNSAVNAAEMLKEEFPERTVKAFDSCSAGLGVGILALKALDMKNDGMELNDIYNSLFKEREGLYEFFTVDDLVYLKRSGRLSGIESTVGNILRIKPVLKGDADGHIIQYSKQMGRKKAIDAIVELFKEKARNISQNRVAISHGDCLEEAKMLAKRILEIAKPKELILAMHEPLTGSHVGPGMLGLYFFGEGAKVKA